ncbi:hypothetical protein FRC18_004163 [Serendipita sp. 400]|nr:hypothetical protein FRC18_004163 [Serendipita sp. 400]
MADTNAFSIDNGIVSNEDEESRMESKLETLGLLRKCIQDPSNALVLQLLDTTPSSKFTPY